MDQQMYPYCPEYMATGNHVFGMLSCFCCKSNGYFGIPPNEPIYLHSEKSSGDKKMKNSSVAFHFNNNQPNSQANYQPAYQQDFQEYVPQEYVPQEYFEENAEDENFQDFQYEPCEEGEIVLQLMERFKSCVCCKGEIYTCKGETCQLLGVCYCYLHAELEQDVETKN